MVEMATRNRQEIEIESERAKQAQIQLEKTQAARERAHKQRVRGLEEQVSKSIEHFVQKKKLMEGLKCT